MAWTCCGTARWGCCLAGSGHRPRWARSCGRSPGGTCCSWARCTGSSWRSWPAAARLLPGAETLAFVDIDSQQKRVYGHAKQGAAFGFTKIQGKGLLVRGLNVLAASICTPLAAPVIAGTRLRGGSASSARGAASMITEAVSTARAAGCTGTLIVRMDSAFYG